ncbi:MAG TPA: nitrate reductase cytochrome c-type subunit [Rhodocyclaceae bacterium]|nr:nitrate reductase cytochrome c-type subunit [Rhodocyclaceae bacterium]HNH35557.1 nitrate reductase cytochrome c-type subunit [Rhodocyclaceae bacterium]
MKKTVTITLAVLLTAVSGWGVAQVSTLRGADAGAADSQTFADKQYQGKRPGSEGQKVVTRTFDGQPPVIPHAMPNFDEISLEENQCMGCHSPEKAKEKNAPRVGESHLVGKVLSMARYQCNTCHVPQVDAKPLVDNQFIGHVTKK